jgi:hypothetical protein
MSDLEESQINEIDLGDVSDEISEAGGSEDQSEVNFFGKRS